MIVRLAIAALAFAALFMILGIWVTQHPLSRIDVESVGMRGTALPLAIAFTNSGYGIALTCVALASVVAALVARRPIVLPLAIIGSQILSQAVVTLAKNMYARVRPDAWLYRHEAGYSYPSGHATTAIVFYGTWLAVFWLSPLPLRVRVPIAIVLGSWMIGIGWSRVALGAHYPTDVIGGYLFGAAWICAATALALVWNPELLARHA